jgi:hypothetical protein
MKQPINPHHDNENTHKAIKELIDERVFKFAQAAQKHYKTNDLVVFLDLSEEKPQLEAIKREKLAASPELPESFKAKFANPASALATVLGSPTQSFWFFVIFESGEGACVSINASMLAPGGQA